MYGTDSAPCPTQLREPVDFHTHVDAASDRLIDSVVAAPA